MALISVGCKYEMKMVNRISVESILISGVGQSQFSVTTKFEGDSDRNAKAILYYCNDTLDDSCDPVTHPSARMLTLTRGEGNFKGSVSGLRDPSFAAGDTVNAAVVTSDPAFVEKGAVMRASFVLLNKSTRLQFSLVNPPINSVAGQVMPMFKVEIYDKDGNLAKAATNEVSIAFAPLKDPSQGTAKLTGTLKVKAVEGVATFSNVSIDKAFAGYAFRASSPDLIYGESGFFNITEDSLHHFAVSGFPAVITAGVSSSIVVTAVDQNNNVVKGYAGTIRFLSDDTQITSPADFTFNPLVDNGSKIFSNVALKTAGTKYISVVEIVGGISTNKTGAQVGIIVNHENIAHHFDVIGVPNSVEAGTWQSVTVTARDQYGNKIINYTGTIKFTSNNALNTVPGNYTFNLLDGGDRIFENQLMFKVVSAVSYIRAEVLGSPTIYGVQGAIVVTPAGPSALTSTISGPLGNVVANGVSSAAIEITLLDFNNNAVAGITPTFHATDTGTTNVYSACSLSNAQGKSFCTLKSTKAESKSLAIDTPISKSGAVPVNFVAGPANAATSSISGTSNIQANGTDKSDITILLKDAFGNPTAGYLPTFSATNSGNTNVYTVCSSSNVLGVSNCQLSSQVAEVKTLSITAPVSKIGGTVTFIAGEPDPANCQIVAAPVSVVADGASVATVTITIKDVNNLPINGLVPTFSATDSGATNVYGICSITNLSGISTCTLKSRKAENKTLKIEGGINKLGGMILFIAGAVDASQSTIVGSGPVVANYVDTSTISIYLRDQFANPVSGAIPTFSATDSGATNFYAACTLSTALGLSTCTMKSKKAENKQLSILTPVEKLDGVVTFIAGVADAGNSTIVGSGPVAADGASTSTITINLADIYGNKVSGTAPLFSATNSGNKNSYGACLVSNAAGISSCTLASSYAEIKTLYITDPVVVTGGQVTFSNTSPASTYSTIVGSGPVVANGVAYSTITITIKDGNDNPVDGILPNFVATDSAAANAYTACSVTNASGISNCELRSTKAEVKTLSITAPIIKIGGSVSFNPGPVDAGKSSIVGTGPILADGNAQSSITIVLKDANNNPISSISPNFSATNSGGGNTYVACSLGNQNGESFCGLKSTYAEVKTLAITSPVPKADGAVTFISASISVANSLIVGTTNILADGNAYSAIAIVLRDSNSNPVVGITPQFSATNTDAKNVYSLCTVTSAQGESSCELRSTKAESKVLSITSPISKVGGGVLFLAGAPVAAKSSINGTTNKIANGTDTSAITITLKDINENPVAGITPAFTATNTGGGNIIDACSITNAMGVAVCGLKSTVAETKQLALSFPFELAGNQVAFLSGTVSTVLSSIVASGGPVVADGNAASTITIILKDTSNNPIVGTVPTFSATGSNNSYGACTPTDANGISSCELKSIKAENKTVAITSPAAVAGNSISFIAGAAAGANSTIVGSGPVVADGVAASTITIYIRDANNNPIAAVTPVYSASGLGNIVGGCNATDGTGKANCQLRSTVIGSKVLSITHPVAKTDGSVLFTQGAVVAANSSISVSGGSVVANGVAQATATIVLKDASNNPVAGLTPIFSASGSNNVYVGCPASDASGVSVCYFSSTKAETKTVQLNGPVSVAGNSVIFQAGAADVTKSSIASQEAIVLADGASIAHIKITIKDANSNPLVGVTPSFLATDGGSDNDYGLLCSATNASGESDCTLASRFAENKLLSITAPVVKANGGSVLFISGNADVAKSSIVSVEPSVTADGIAAATIQIILKDANDNALVGVQPQFEATNTGNYNVKTACSLTNSLGLSTCTLTSLYAEVKVLSVTTPIFFNGGSVTFESAGAVAANSSIVGSLSGLVVADNVQTSTVTITLKDIVGSAVAGVVPQITVTGIDNTVENCSGATNASGVATCLLRSTKAETKTLKITWPVSKTGGSVIFIAGAASVAKSSISGSTPVAADGIATSQVIVVLKDQFENPIKFYDRPTFHATDGGADNIYGACSVTDALGAASCSLASQTVEAKTLTLEDTDPDLDSVSPVNFVVGPAVLANSSMSALDANFVADNADAGLINIVLKDIKNRVIVGTTPSISVSGSNNVVACNATDASGVAQCTIKSTKAEAKTVALISPALAVAPVLLTAQPGAAVAVNSNITGPGGYTAADGVAVAAITITLTDINGNLISGVTPDFSVSGASYTKVACGPTNASGVASCGLKSTVAEIKTVTLISPNLGNTALVSFSINVLTLGTLDLHHIYGNRFTADVACSDDQNGDGIVRLYYCNEAVSGVNCDPQLGTYFSLARVAGQNVCTGTVTGLTNPGNHFNVKAVAIDPDGISGSPVIGEVTLPVGKQIFRSVSASSAAKVTGSVDNELVVTAATSQASFELLPYGEVTVGDALVINGSTILFIHGIISDTLFTVKNANGDAPASNISSTATWTIYRPYASLADAATMTENTNIGMGDFDDFDSSKNLVTADVIWNIVCVDDNVADNSQPQFIGWITEGGNYINIFTPTSAAQTKQSARHVGKYASNRYIINSGNGEAALHLDVDYVRVLGLQIFTNIDGADGIKYTGEGELQVEKNIIASAATTDRGNGIDLSEVKARAVVKIWNNAIYAWEQGIFLDNSINQYWPLLAAVYNNSVVDAASNGIFLKGASANNLFYLKNNLVQKTTLSDYVLANITSSTANLSEDGSSPNATQKNKVIDFTAYVVDSDYTNDDLHTNDSDVSGGTTLSGDTVLPISDDIDGAARSVWDIGADE